MVRNLVAVSALALGLAGCSLGISQDSASPHSEFKAPVNYKDAYATVVRQANACLRSTDNAYRVVANPVSVSYTHLTLPTKRIV